MISEVMKTISKPCAIRLTRNSRINIGKTLSFPCVAHATPQGRLQLQGLGVSSRDRRKRAALSRSRGRGTTQPSRQRRLGHVLHAIRVDVETVEFLVVGMDEDRGEQRQRRRLSRDRRQRLRLKDLLALLDRGSVALLVEHRVDFLVDDAADALRRRMEVRADHEIGLGRARAPAAIDHVAFAAAGLVIEQIAPGRDFERLQVHLEALLLKHAGDELGIFLGLWIEADRRIIGELGKALALGEAGLGEKRLRLVGIELGIVRDLGIAELDRRDMGLGVGAGDAENVEHLLAVDRMAGREPYARIVERLLRTAEEQIFVLDRHRLVDVEARILRDRVDLLGFEALDDVGFAIEQRERAGRGVTDEVILDAGNLRRAHEEVRIGGEDRRVALLLHIFEGAGAVHARRKLRLVRHILGGHDRQERREIIIERRGVAELLGVDVAGVIVDDVDLDLSWIPLRRSVGHAAIFVGRLHVGGGERFAVMEFHALAELHLHRVFVDGVESTLGELEDQFVRLLGRIGARVR